MNRTDIEQSKLEVELAERLSPKNNWVPDIDALTRISTSEEDFAKRLKQFYAERDLYHNGNCVYHCH
jgi:hypothetical protein